MDSNKVRRGMFLAFRRRRAVSCAARCFLSTYNSVCVVLRVTCPGSGSCSYCAYSKKRTTGEHVLSFSVSAEHNVSYVVDPFFNEGKSVREWDFVKVPVPSGEQYRSVQLLQILLTECELGSTYDTNGVSWLFCVRYVASLGMWSGGLGYLIGLVGSKFPTGSGAEKSDVETGGKPAFRPDHPRSFFCSELAMESLKYVGFFRGYQSQLSTPQSLYNLVVKSKWKLYPRIGRDPSKSSSVLVRITASDKGIGASDAGSRARPARKNTHTHTNQTQRTIPDDMRKLHLY
jgi:hypothetical protein